MLSIGLGRSRWVYVGVDGSGLEYNLVMTNCKLLTVSSAVNIYSCYFQSQSEILLKIIKKIPFRYIFKQMKSTTNLLLQNPFQLIFIYNYFSQIISPFKTHFHELFLI